MSQFPNFPPPSGRYSPSQPAYGRPPFPPSNPPRDFPPFPPGVSPPPSATFRPYDPYSSEPPRPPFPYDQPRSSFDAGSYDPYQPAASGYNPSAPSIPSIRPPPPVSAYSPPPPLASYMPPVPPPRTFNSPPKRSAPLPRVQSRAPDSEELHLLTTPTSLSVYGFTSAGYSLPPSHLPISKYVAMNPDDAIDIHRHICIRSKSVWYAEGCSRAGEGWSAAVEWILGDPGRSGSKMRACVEGADAMDAEIGGIVKAVEGFLELLRHSIKNATPMSHELVVFCTSPAAIVSVDTSSRPESLRFETLWRDICSEFLQAHLTLVWVPRSINVEGLVLANRIATVGASNSYLKRRKEGTLSEPYRRPGGGDPFPGGSTEPGPWQRGDADPSRRKEPFDRPIPVPISPPRIPEPAPVSNGLDVNLGPQAADDRPEAEDEPIQPKEGSIFVTHFPEGATAKDLGILFSQFGDIVAVDIYHLSPEHPGFAFVGYSDDSASINAITALHSKPVDLTTQFAVENMGDLEIWKDWPGQLTVVLAEPERLIPSSVAAQFPNLPDWAQGSRAGAAAPVADVPIDADMSKKRDREVDSTPAVHGSTPPSSIIESPSPHKRPRQDDPKIQAQSSSPPPLPDALTKTETTSMATQPDTERVSSAAPTAQIPSTKSRESSTTSTANPSKSEKKTPPPVVPIALPTNGSYLTDTLPSSVLPPTPNTAERPHSNDRSSSSSSTAKPPLTNSAAEPQENPIQVGVKTLRSTLNLVQNILPRHDAGNWIAHSCLIATDLDQARRALQGDLYSTDEAFLSGREFEKVLSGRGFTPQRVDAFITKVLNVLDGIAMAEQGEDESAGNQTDTVEDLRRQLDEALSKYPDETKQAVENASRVMEFLVRGKELQEKKRLDIERRVKVLEGMVKKGDVVTGVVRFLLTEDK